MPLVAQFTLSLTQRSFRTPGTLDHLHMFFVSDTSVSLICFAFGGVLITEWMNWWPLIPFQPYAEYLLSCRWLVTSLGSWMGEIYPSTSDSICCLWHRTHRHLLAVKNRESVSEGQQMKLQLTIRVTLLWCTLFGGLFPAGLCFWFDTHVYIYMFVCVFFFIYIYISYFPLLSVTRRVGFFASNPF